MAPAVFAGDQKTPLLRGRVRTAEVRAQTDADAEFVAHAAADIATLLDQRAYARGRHAAAEGRGS